MDTMTTIDIIPRIGGKLNILALDLETKTGWAFWHEVSGHESGIVNFAPLKNDPGSRFTKLREWFKWIIQPDPEADLPDVIYYEDVHLRGKGSVVLAGLVCHMVEIASIYGIQCKPVHSGTLKKFATGNGKATKKDMIHAAQRLGYFPKDDNEADALMLMEYAKAKETK